MVQVIAGRALEGWQGWRLPSQNFVLQMVEFYIYAFLKNFSPRKKFLAPSLVMVHVRFGFFDKFCTPVCHFWIYSCPSANVKLKLKLYKSLNRIFFVTEIFYNVIVFILLNHIMEVTLRLKIFSHYRKWCWCWTFKCEY